MELRAFLWDADMNKTNIITLGHKLDVPFLMHRVATIDHFSAYLYVCDGFVAKHRHISQDELFVVIDGVMGIDTDWGNVALVDDEFVVIPRGLTHRSGSIVHTLVMLFQAQTDPDRKNGHGQLFVDTRAGELSKGALRVSPDGSRPAYRPERLAQVDEMSLRRMHCAGTTPWHRHVEHDELLWVREGHLEVGTEHGGVRLEANDLGVIPRNTIHRLSAQGQALALGFIHDQVTPAAHMGLMGETGLD
jgi:mannose-6-phosphate isomerase-like protein (cupin superfamily)